MKGDVNMAQRRTKMEMLWMKKEVRKWLIRHGNNPHKAWDAYVAHHLKNNLVMDYYIKGLKDFVNVSNELTGQMEKAKRKKEYRAKMQHRKARMINELKKLSKDDAVRLWKTNKDKFNSTDKLTLADIVSMIIAQDYNIDQRHLNLLQNLDFPASR